MSFWRGIRETLDGTGKTRFNPCPRDLQTQQATNTPYTFSFPTTSLAHITTFLYTHFGESIEGPRLCLELTPGPEEVVLQATDASDQLVGCVRFHYAGQFEEQRIHIIDAFCVRPENRRTGLASRLLATLHVETQARGMPYSVFLKEGRPLPIAHQPLYSSLYAYREAPRGLKENPLVRALTGRQASAIVRAFCALRPDTFVLWDPANSNQQWFTWKEGIDWMLICYQDAHQELKSRIGGGGGGGGERIGCLVGLLESPTLAVSPKRRVALESLVAVSPYPWIWTDRVFLRGDMTNWEADGPFHWYAYGWTTTLRPSPNYIIAV